MDVNDLVAYMLIDVNMNVEYYKIIYWWSIIEENIPPLRVIDIPFGKKIYCIAEYNTEAHCIPSYSKRRLISSPFGNHHWLYRKMQRMTCRINKHNWH